MLPQVSEFNHKGIAKERVYHWAVDDVQGSMVWIEKGILRIDPSYQRKTAPAKIANIRRSWSWVACAALVVAKRPDGSLWVIDGQHRLNAALAIESIKKLPCLVFPCNEIQAEAGNFIATNVNRKPLTGADKFSALMLSGCQTASAVTGILSENGYEPAKGTGANRGQVLCLGLLMTEASRGDNVLRDVFPLVALLFDGDPPNQQIIAGICLLERHLRKNSTDSVMHRSNSDKLLAAGVSAIMQQIASAVALYGSGGPKIWARGIAEVLNKSKRAQNRIVID